MKVGDTATRTLEIQNTLIGTKVPSLFEAGRVFVFEGDLHKITSRFVVKCHIFLFNDIMLYAHKKVLSWWIHKGTLHLGNCWTRALDDTPRYKNLFQIVAPSKTWTFYCKSPEERDVWLKNLDKVITLLVESNPKYLSQRDKVNVKVRGGIFKASSSRNKAEFDPEYALQPAGYSSSSSSSDSSSSSGGATTITTTGDLTTTTISSTSSKSVAITVTTSASTQSSATVTSSSAAAIIASSDESPKKTVCKSSLKNEVKRPLLSAENDEEEEENEGKNGDYGGNRSVNGSREEPTESTSLFPFTSRASSIYSSCKAFVSDMFSCCTIL